MSRQKLGGYSDRRRLLDAVVRGVPAVNRLFGTAIPSNLASNFGEIADREAREGPDFDYACMLAALFGRHFTIPQEFDALIAQYPALIRDAGCFEHWAANAIRYNGVADHELVAAVHDRFAMRRLDLLQTFERRIFVALKVNHVQWEQTAWLGLGSASLPAIREFDRGTIDTFRLYHRSRFDDLLVAAMRLLETVPGCFIGPGHALGLGLSNADTSFEEDLEVPLHPVPRGAAIGLLAFFDGFAPGQRVQAADPVSLKEVFWGGKLDLLARLAAGSSDAVIFVVPPHLSGIRLRAPEPAQEAISVPGIYIHELWPAVMAGVAGQMIELLDRYRRVTVFMQAGAMSVPIGTLIHLLARERAGNSVHCFDFGQMLDVAVSPSEAAGPWRSKPEVCDAIAAQPIPFVIDGCG